MNQFTTSLLRALKLLTRFRLAIFLAFVGMVYGYLVWRVNVLSNVAPDASVTTQINATRPHIDQATVEKIKQLQDNSVNVQTLFNHARQNPFQE